MKKLVPRLVTHQPYTYHPDVRETQHCHPHRNVGRLAHGVVVTDQPGAQEVPALDRLVVASGCRWSGGPSVDVRLVSRSGRLARARQIDHVRENASAGLADSGDYAIGRGYSS
jgi:hypothetical protein